MSWSRVRFRFTHAQSQPGDKALGIRYRKRQRSRGALQISSWVANENFLRASKRGKYLKNPRLSQFMVEYPSRVAKRDARSVLRVCDEIQEVTNVVKLQQAGLDCPSAVDAVGASLCEYPLRRASKHRAWRLSL
jgi:hypothetical protein